jgi:catechol 2,3-dioxygenase-like lactoylglutathione lyase family enzyme
MEKDKIAVRYIVNDVEKSISFYKDQLDFSVDMHPAPGFAALSKGNLILFLNQPGAGGAGQKMPDGTVPQSGGWNRIQITVEDLESVYQKFKKKGLEFRNEIVDGLGGKQILLKDPSGNLIELFEPKRDEEVQQSDGRLEKSFSANR